MSKQTIISILVAVVVISGAWYAVSINKGQENDSGIVAVVNGAELSRKDFDNQFSRAEQSYLQRGLDVNDEQIIAQLKTQVLDQLIAQALIKQEAEKVGISVDGAEIEAEVASIIESLGGQEVFDQQLANVNLSKEELEDDVKEQLLINKYIDTQSPEDQVVTDEEALALYDQLSAQQDLPPFNDVEDEIRAEALRLKNNQFIQELVASLRENAEIVTLL